MELKNVIELKEVIDKGNRESVKFKGKIYKRLRCIGEDDKEYRFNTSECINEDLDLMLRDFKLPYIELTNKKSDYLGKITEWIEVKLPEEYTTGMFEKCLYKKI